MPPISPTVARWELALRLRQRRLQLGLDVETITDKLGFNRTFWSHVENNRKVLAGDKLDILLDLYDVDAAERKELHAAREATKLRGWWSAYSGLFSDELLRLFGLEYGAEGVRTYNNLLIPGLLQTEEYARALMVSDMAAIRPAEIEQRLEARLRRQDRLMGVDALRFTAVLSEAALRQQTGGGPEVQARQLEHLLALLAERPNTIDVRILPFTTAVGAVLGASTFHLLDFPNPRLPMIGWHESVTFGAVVEKRTQVRELDVCFTQAFTRALSRKDSLDLINSTLDGLS